MSKLEERVIRELRSLGVEIQKPVPIKEFPWETSRTKTSPKSDIYIPRFDLYIEVKGFMTIEAMSKMAYLSKQGFRYYIFQGTEYEWVPYYKSYLYLDSPEIIDIYRMSKTRRLKFNIDFQLKELMNLKTLSRPLDFLENISKITNLRLKNFITLKTETYKAWTNESFI
jgi:hypothetical protein